MVAKRLLIVGRVQGVGYRDWMVHKARGFGLSGWVRNKGDDAVEALVAGDVAAVEEMSRLCRRGPRMAEVVSITEDLAEPPAEPGFYRAASAGA
jgi:acylphosphatase